MNADQIVKFSISSKRVIPETVIEAAISRQEDTSLKSPGVAAHYYRFFYFLARALKPAVCVELGTHTGLSSLCLAAGNPDGKVYTVDHQNRVYEKCKRPNIVYFVRDSLEIINVDWIDVLFLDTDHDGVRPLKEYHLYEPRVRPGGLIFFDDINLNEKMLKFWSEFKPNGEKIELGVHGKAGFGLVIKEG